jgi:putative nucleotidyltransferase with HDIG domain
VNVPPRLSNLGRMNTMASWAGQLAQVLLQESLPRRWAHVQGVAARARSLAPVLGADADLLEAAAWLHDIGYAPGLATTGLHALDGARYLRDTQHADTLLCRLVAHHTCAIIEAEERGLADILDLEFQSVPEELSSVLTYCDITTSPDGELVPAEQRLAEIQQRYGPGHLVSRSMQRATPMILRAVEQVQAEPPGAHSSAHRKRGADLGAYRA